MAKSSVPMLLKLLDDPHEWVKEAAAQAIEAIEPEATTEAGTDLISAELSEE